MIEPFDRGNHHAPVISNAKISKFVIMACCSPWCVQMSKECAIFLIPCQQAELTWIIRYTPKSFAYHVILVILKINFAILEIGFVVPEAYWLSEPGKRAPMFISSCNFFLRNLTLELGFRSHFQHSQHFQISWNKQKMLNLNLQFVCKLCDFSLIVSIFCRESLIQLFYLLLAILVMYGVSFIE